MGTLPSALPGRYLLVNEQESAGICLVSLKNLLFDEHAIAGRPPAGPGIDLGPRAERFRSEVRAWLEAHRVLLSDLSTEAEAHGFYPETLMTRMQAFRRCSTGCTPGMGGYPSRPSGCR